VLYLQRNEHSNERIPPETQVGSIQQDHSLQTAMVSEQQVIQPQSDEHLVDSFDLALALHQKALEGDAKSQYLLGNIILECYFFLKTSSR
jgi:hypothetical protein